MARIVHCATTHRAGDPRIFVKEARTLADAGHDVTYVCPHERDEVIDGVTILGVPRPKSGGERLLLTTRRVMRRARAVHPDAILHLHDSELLPLGILARRQGRRVVYDAHEDTPKQMRYQHWLPRPVRPVAAAVYGGLELIAGKTFDGIIAAEPRNASRFPEARTALVRNYPRVEELRSENATPYAERDPVILYVGAITVVRGLWGMIEAVQMLPSGFGARLVLGGSVHPPSLEEEVRRVHGCEVRGYLSREEVARWMGRARVGVVVLHPTDKYVESYPTKLFEYMAAGVPVVASNFPEWERIVREAGCGLTVDPMNPSSISDAIRWLLQNPERAHEMGERGRRAVERDYDWAHEGEVLLSFYDRLLADGS